MAASDGGTKTELASVLAECKPVLALQEVHAQFHIHIRCTLRAHRRRLGVPASRGRIPGSSHAKGFFLFEAHTVLVFQPRCVDVFHGVVVFLRLRNVQRNASRESWLLGRMRVSF